MPNFEYAAMLTETVLLGNVAMRVGKKLVWDGPKLKATNCPEAGPFDLLWHGRETVPQRGVWRETVPQRAAGGKRARADESDSVHRFALGPLRAWASRRRKASTMKSAHSAAVKRE